MGKESAPERQPQSGFVRGLREESTTIGNHSPMFDPQDISALSNAISLARLKPYLSHTNGNHEAALHLYAWNMEISAALWGGFHLLEITLRNSLHNQLVTLTGADDWWNIRSDEDRNESLLSPSLLILIDKALSKSARRRRASFEVISEISFGFWSGLLSKKFHERLWTGKLENAFPSYAGQRDSLHASLEVMRLIRNRIAHHEPIYERDILSDHFQICAILGFIEPRAEAWLRQNSRVPEVMSSKSLKIAGEIPTRF